MDKTRATVMVALLVLALGLIVPVPEAQADAGSCGAGLNKIACENQLPGNPASEWDVGDGDTDIQGFATDFSVNVGTTARFKVTTTAATLSIDIYRFGYYQGLGARKVATLANVAGRNQPACLNDAATGLIDCGNWSESASWTVPSTAVSGVYAAVFTRADNQNRSMTPFIVRDDASHSDLTYQTSDTTWQAYNNWGGNSLYAGNPIGRAYKVSYNRPWNTRGGTPEGRDFLFSTEYPMIRFLERNGYDVTYQSGIDTDRHGALLTNHKTFVSIGHDEYWSGPQRTNVEAARDAGVNLAFFSGNEVYWKTRYEPSIDGSGTPYRTLVTYKETKANAKIDPSPTWTGTWRDPRFSPPADGGRPENALTGTAYMVNCCNSPMSVPSADGKMRFWRNTSVANLSSGQSATLADNTLGYEFDETPDNGFQPAGLVPLSTTTLATSEYLQDYGSTVLPGVATHHLALHRAASGALVFGAGTVQWSWGLDPEHDGPTAPADARMQQATVNLLADMGAQPTTLLSGLTAATASSDHTAPVAAIAAPTAGAVLDGGSVFTIAGTATDVGGGVVGAVEVSTDNGATWHPATGRGTWSYGWTPNGIGPVTILVRATDDSGNTQSSPTAVTVTQRCPCSLFAGRSPGVQPPSTDTSTVSLGVKVRSDRDGFITGVRFYKEAGNGGTHTGSLWTATGTRLATGTFANESATGWQTLTFANPVAISANTTYIASYFAPQGHYTAKAGFFTTATNVPPLLARASTTGDGNGVYLAGSDGFPTSTFGAANYWIDVDFNTILVNDHAGPIAQAGSPAPGSTGASINTIPVASFNEPIQASSIQMTLTPAAGSPIAGAVSYDGLTQAASFTPTAPLATSTTYTVAVTAATDLSGNAMTAPMSWTFTTSADPTGCPCSLFGVNVPATTWVNDPGAVSLGVKFTTEADGFITRIRFFKGTGNGGTHTGSLWTTDGTRLATGTFTNESASGWQTLVLSSPVAVHGGTTYVASYYAPQGHYAATAGAFDNTLDVPPLHAPATGPAGGNGVYRYGGDSFPTDNWGATNYWVDVEFINDTTPPSATPTLPAPGATGRSIRTTASATFNKRVQAGTIQFTLAAPNGTAVPGTVAFDSQTLVATFTPTSTLATSTTYTATVANARDLAGNIMATPSTWSFTTSSDPTGCPCGLFGSAAPATTSVNDPSAVSLGVKFTSEVDGWISEVRFYKGTGNGGAHTGSLWSLAGQRLATGTFTGETASGWQTLTFADPVPITAGTTYVASYFAPQGHYAAVGGFFANALDVPPLHAPASTTIGGNGVYRYGSDAFPTDTYGSTNYAIDVTIQRTPPPDSIAPTAQPTSPGPGSTNAATTTTVAAQFSEPVNASSIGFTLSSAGGAVTGTVTYDALSHIATFTPAAPLAPGTLYSATVSGAVDLAGNAMRGTTSWTFTTSTDASGCPCSLFGATAPPNGPANDPSAVSLGMKFTVDFDGSVTGVRYYKGAGTFGTHTGSLWATNGTRLATATFTGETSSGWQRATFATPVAVTAGTTYVVSFFAPQGNYSATGGFFSSGFDAGPIHAPSSSASGGNGVYVYGADAYPQGTYNAANYWVDPLYIRS